MSGVTVPTMIRPMSFGASPARSMRLRRAASFAEIGRRHARIDDVPLANAGSLQNPLVGGVDHLFEVGVGEDTRRDIGRQRRNRRGPSAAARPRGRAARP